MRRKLDPVQLWLGVRQVAIAGLPLATLYCFLFVVAKSVGWSAAWTPTVPMLVLQITGWVWLMYVVRSLFPNSYVPLPLRLGGISRRSVSARAQICVSLILWLLVAVYVAAHDAQRKRKAIVLKRSCCYVDAGSLNNPLFKGSTEKLRYLGKIGDYMFFVRYNGDELLITQLSNFATCEMHKAKVDQ